MRFIEKIASATFYECLQDQIDLLDQEVLPF